MAYVGEMLFYLCISSYIKIVNVISCVKCLLLSSDSHVVGHLLLFGQLSPRKKKSFKQVHDGMFKFFSPFSLPTYFMVYKVCIATLPCSFWKFHLRTSVVRTSKQSQYLAELFLKLLNLWVSSKHWPSS